MIFIIKKYFDADHEPSDAFDESPSFPPINGYEPSDGQQQAHDFSDYDSGGGDSHDYEGYDAAGYDAAGYDAAGYDGESYDGESYDGESYGSEGSHIDEISGASYLLADPIQGQDKITPIEAMFGFSMPSRATEGVHRFFGIFVKIGQGYLPGIALASKPLGLNLNFILGEPINYDLVSLLNPDPNNPHEDERPSIEASMAAVRSRGG